MALRSKKKAKSSNTVTVDMSGVKGLGRIDEGKYLATVESVELKTSDNSGKEYLNWKLDLGGNTIWHMTSLSEGALWGLKSFLEAAGIDVPDGEMELELDEYEGLTLGVEVADDEYQGNKRSRIIDVFPEDELEEDDEPSKKPAKPSSKKSSARDNDEAEEVDLDDMDLEELLEFAEETNLKVPARLKKSESRVRKFIQENLSNDEDDEEEEEETPKKSRRTSAKFKVGDKVTFEEDDDEIEGKITQIMKDGTIVVDADGEEWELSADDLTKA